MAIRTSPATPLLPIRRTWSIVGMPPMSIFFGVASPQGARATEWSKVNHGDGLSRCTNAGRHTHRRRPGADDNEVVLTSHGVSLSNDGAWLAEYGGRRASSARAAGSRVGLDGRALMGAVGTEHAAVARERTQDGLAAFALVEPLARVGRHRFLFDVAAIRARDGRPKNDFAHVTAVA